MRSLTLATVVADDDAIKLAFLLSTDESIKASVATVVAPVSYDGEDLDGTIGASTMYPPRKISVHLAAAAGAYVADSTITVTGLDADGEELVDTVTIVGTDGDEDLETTELFASVVSIDIEAQADTDGAFLFGVIPHSFGGDALDGVTGGDVMFPPRIVTVKTTAAALAYDVGSTVVVWGRDADGRSVSETFELTAAGGNETLVGAVGFSVVSSVDVDPQLLATAQFKIGVRDFLFGAEVPTGLRFGAVGNIKLGYEGGATDTIATLIVGEHLPVQPKRIYATADTTTSKVTLVF